MDFLEAASYREGVEVVHRELSVAFEKLNMCTCGREFLKALFKCAPFYNGNALFALVGDNEDSIVAYGRAARHLDLKSASKFFDKLMAGVCAKSESGMCLNSIFNGFEELTELLETTVKGYEDYDDGDRKYQKSQEKRCDALFGPIRAWSEDDRETWRYDGEEYWDLTFNKTAAVTKALYCEKRCKKTRGALYPCCLKKMLEDDKMFDNVAKVIESVYKIIPALDGNFEWSGFYELDYYFAREYSKEELANIMAWEISERTRDTFMRTVHGARYCEGKTVRCSK